MNSKNKIIDLDFEDKVFEIIQSTSFKGLLKSNRTEDKKIIAEYYEKIEIYHLAIEVYLSLQDYNSIKRLLKFGNQRSEKNLTDTNGK